MGGGGGGNGPAGAVGARALSVRTAFSGRPRRPRRGRLGGAISSAASRAADATRATAARRRAVRRKSANKLALRQTRPLTLKKKRTDKFQKTKQTKQGSDSNFKCRCDSDRVSVRLCRTYLRNGVGFVVVVVVVVAVVVVVGSRGSSVEMPRRDSSSRLFIAHLSADAAVHHF